MLCMAMSKGDSNCCLHARQVGAVPNTFGTPGVAEHCFFMKARIILSLLSVLTWWLQQLLPCSRKCTPHPPARRLTERCQFPKEG